MNYLVISNTVYRRALATQHECFSPLPLFTMKEDETFLEEMYFINVDIIYKNLQIFDWDIKYKFLIILI